MYQTDRGNYRKKESFRHAFTHSCLGRLAIFAAVLVVLMIVASLTVPGEQTMRDEMTDNILQCIQTNDSIKTDGIDDAINNVGYIFTHADSVVDKEMWDSFNRYNRLEYYKHALFSTTYIFNNFRPDGVRCGIGFMGVVIPTISFSDIVLRTGPMHKGYNKQIINTTVPDQYFGDNPHVKEFHYQGNPND